MAQIISIDTITYDRLKAKTNNLGGRNPDKISFSKVINQALDDQEILNNLKSEN